MAEMGRYCKAYLASDLKKYPGWEPDLSQLRQPEAEKPNEEPEPRTELLDDDIVYIQEDLVVTDGIFKDENVLFRGNDEAWQKFCEETLEFAIPEDVLAIAAQEEEEAAAAEAQEAEESAEGEEQAESEA